MKFEKILNTNLEISEREVFRKDMVWEDTHYALNKKGLYMPAPKLFFPYFFSLKQDTKIYFSYNGLIKPIYIWLDAEFKKGKGFLNLNIETDHRIEDGRLVAETIEPLEVCVKEDCFVESGYVNSQGLPTKKSRVQKFKRGENYYNMFPMEGRVARFDADSDRAYFDCYRDPSNSNASLGVRQCAEGASQKISAPNIEELIKYSNQFIPEVLQSKFEKGFRKRFK